jgi:transcriptional regulator with XRE-family HTH domain
MDLGKRVKELRKAQRWTQAGLAKRTSLSRGRIAQIETDPLAKVGGNSLVSLAKAFGYSTEQLLSADELGLLADLKLQPFTRKVPLIDWKSLKSIVDKTFVLESSNWIGCPYDLSEKSFVLEVQDELMTSIHGRSYPIGALIFVDAEREPKAGERVIAMDTVTLSAVFREYVISGSATYLAPLNERYPIKALQQSTRIIGVVVGSYMPG